MYRSMLGRVALLSFTLVSACTDDDSRGKEVVAPDVLVGGSVAANRSDEDSDSDGTIGIIKMEDACDPDDPAWNALGGCLQSRGTVSLAEFNAELQSTLSPTVIGHPSWLNDPATGVLRAGQTIRVRNTGGRAHTFTKVAQFGGGKVPPLSTGLAPAPECATSIDVPAGGRTQVSGLSAGSHRFQCCIHPWMRAVIEVKAR